MLTHKSVDIGGEVGGMNSFEALNNVAFHVLTINRWQGKQHCFCFSYIS